jgi:hypothetical protein
MSKWRDLAFIAAFGMLTTHELDAVRCGEWRILPGLSLLSDGVGMTIFILAHIPLFGWLASVCWSSNPDVRALARQAFCGFCIIHIGLHWIFRLDPDYAFSGLLSNGLIGGAGLFGVLFLLMTSRGSLKL